MDDKVIGAAERMQRMRGRYAVGKSQVSAVMTVAEFIAWPGDGRGGRYQLVDGELRAMSPASATHGTIQMTLGRLIANHLYVPGNRCRVVAELAIAVRVRASSNLRVPDLGVSCAPDAPGQVALPDPILLIEILPPGDAADTWDNVWAYTTIPTLAESVVVDATRIHAELLRRQADGSWPADPEEIGPEGTLELTSIGLTLALRTAYVMTHLA
jgi:Uma2 family endonuclease